MEGWWGYKIVVGVKRKKMKKRKEGFNEFLSTNGENIIHYNRVTLRTNMEYCIYTMRNSFITNIYYSQLCLG